MDSRVPEPWFRKAALYHIYPLSFYDSNGDGFGDLAGILRKLDYLNDGTGGGLGVGAIWLSPIYQTGMADWGYDVADHCTVDARFGTMEDFDRLIAEVHARGMKLLLDYVPNHTSVMHRWFMKSRESKTNEYRDWYIWADGNEDGGPPNNWQSYFGGPAWTLDRTTGQYYLHTFLPEQPDLNWRNPKVRAAMLDVLRFWLKRGVDGFRTDAVLGLLKDDKLRDDPPNPNYRPDVSDPADKYLRVHSSGQRELGNVIGSFCDVLAEKDGTFLLSEAYLNVPGLHQLYEACVKHPIHAPFNFNLMTLEWGAQQFRQFIDEYEAMLGPEDWPNYVLGNHDRHRLVSRVGSERARLLALLEMTLRGMPVVYYGEELGLPDTPIGSKDARDPWELRVPGRGLGRDPERTPLPWSDHPNAGFTTGTPWLPIGNSAGTLNVEAQDRDPNSFLNLYRHLIHLRTDSPALIEGEYRSLESSNPMVYMFARETPLQRFTVVLNFDSKPQQINLKPAIGRFVAGTHEVEGDGELATGGRDELAPYEGRVYESGRGRE